MAETRTAAPGAAAPAAGARLSVDRLTVHVPPMSEQDARRLAELIGEALREWPTAPAASGRISGLSVSTTSGAAPSAGSSAAGAAATPESLAIRIAEAVFAAALRELS